MSSSEISIDEILKILPHRYPFLLIDRVINYDTKGGTLTAIKNVTINEPFFQGHFPFNPVMPGVLIIEAMAQACGVLAMQTSSESAVGRLVYLASIENAKFRRPVKPGDVLTINVKVRRARTSTSVMECEAYVGDKLAAEATIMATITS